MYGEGANVVIVGRKADKLTMAAQEIGSDILTIGADVATIEGIETVIRSVKEKYGVIDVLFANAGMSDSPEVFETDEAAYKLSMDTNVKSVFFLFTKSFPLLAEKASVIFTSSMAHLKGRPGDPLYAATKAAVRSLGRTFAMNEEVLGKKIRVNVVSPGAVQTPLTKQENDEMQQAIDDYITAAVPVGRWGLPEEIAKAVLFLACDDSSYITGADIQVDGGWGQV
jgi:NAD(P)-dependent dehydrogenase (short-subunit alcohol dehydrogenase family)